MVIPRSLNDPVGFAPSNFRYRSMLGAIRLANRDARISGVFPSCSVMTGVRSLTGKNFLYSSMTPRQVMALLVLALDSDQGRRLGHERHAVDLDESGLHFAFSRAVGFDDDRNGLSLPPSLLQHRGDADAVTSQLTCDLGQHAGAIGHHETQIIERANFFDRPYAEGTPFLRLEGRRRYTARSAVKQIAGSGDDVADDGAAGGQVSRPPAAQHDVADRISGQLNGVIHSLDLCQRGISAQHRRMHAGLYVALDEFGYAQQLDRVAELLCIGNIMLGNVCDAFRVEILEIDRRAESQIDENRQLVRAVGAGHIDRRIGL